MKILSPINTPIRQTFSTPFFSGVFNLLVLLRIILKTSYGVPSKIGIILNMRTLSPVRALWTSLFITAFYPIVGKLSVGGISPSILLLLGTGLAASVYTPMMIKQNLFPVFFKRNILTQFAIVGFFGTAMPFLLILTALKYTTPSNAAILNQVEVIYSLVLTWIFLKERPTGKQLIGTAMVIAGVIIIVLNETFSMRWKGDLIVICTVWMFQISHIAAKKLPADLTPHFLAFGRAFFGFFWSVPIAAILYFSGEQFVFNASWGTLAIVLYLGLINYVIGNATWYMAIRNMDLSKATAVILSYPVFTYIFSVMIGLDKVHSYQIAGLALALCGAYLVTNIIKKGNSEK